jgi:tetratricopeptide (TPR) repeat protein
LALDPANRNALDTVGAALFNLGRYSEAEDAYRNVVALDAQNPLYLNHLADALLEQGKLAEAEQMLREVLTVNPNSPDAHISLGRLYLQKDRPDLAWQEFQTAMQLTSPDLAFSIQPLVDEASQPERWLTLADAWMEQANYDEAVKAYYQAGQFGAPSADVAYGVSSAYIQLKDWDTARQVLEQAIQTTPEDARLYNNLGIIARAQGDLEAARQYFQQAIDLAPDWDEPQKNLNALP